jgi:peptidyl-prolyl cis-trans isomerase SurA
VKFNQRVILIVSILCLLNLPVYAETVDKIVAIVNDEIITLSELNEGFAPFAKNIEKTYKGNNLDRDLNNTKASFLQRLIDNILIEQEAKKTGAANIKDEEIMDVLNDMLARNKTSLKDYSKRLEEEGSSLDAIKLEIKRQLMRMRLLRREIRSKIIVTDQEIGEYYNEHRQEYEGKEAVRIKQILLRVPPDATKETVEKFKAQAQQLHQRAISGESFDALAAMYSQGPAAAQGGDVGFIERGSIIPEVEAVAFALPLEQVSKVIESNVGLHIIKVVDKRGAGLKPLADVRLEIKTKMEDEKLEKKYDEWIASVRKKSFIDIRY